MTLVGLHHVQLAMPPGREEDARAFYAGRLGHEEVPKPPLLAARGGVWFRARPGARTTGALELHLGVEDPFVPARKAHPGLLASDLDGLAAALASGGVPVRWDADLPGFRRCYVDDPFGNRTELLEPA